MGHIIELKKAAVAYGEDELLPGYEHKPPFSVTMTESKGKAFNSLLARIHTNKPRTMAGWALWYLEYNEAHPGVIHYEELRPMMPLVRPPLVITHMDCSTFATLMAWLVGIDDPNGNGYNREGNTATLAVHGVRVAKPAASDFVFYTDGSEPITHVAVAISAIEVVSMGMEGDPNKRVLADCGNAALRLVEVRRYV